jgi:hypothetical protein
MVCHGVGWMDGRTDGDDGNERNVEMKMGGNEMPREGATGMWGGGGGVNKGHVRIAALIAPSSVRGECGRG